MAGYVDRRVLQTLIEAVANDEPMTSPAIKIIGTVYQVIPPNESSDNQTKYEVVLDGSPDGTPIPVSSTLGETVLKPDDRVLILMGEHGATIVGNLTKPADESIKEEVEKTIDEVVPEMIGSLADMTIEYAISTQGREPSEDDWSTSFIPPTEAKPICWIRTVNKEGKVIKPAEQATVYNNPFLFMSKVARVDDDYTLIDGGYIDTNTLSTNTVIVGVRNTANTANTNANSAKTTAASALATAQGAGATATNYITAIDGGGIKVHDANNFTNYLQLISSGLGIYLNNGLMTNLAKDQASFLNGIGLLKTKYYSALNQANVELSNGLTSGDRFTTLSCGNAYVTCSTQANGSIDIYTNGDIDASGCNIDADIITGDGIRTTTTKTASTPAGIVTDTGALRKYSGSSKRYKKNIRNLNESELESIRGLYDVDVKSWEYKEGYIDEDDDLYHKTIFGVIAEDVTEKIPILQELDENGFVMNYKDRLLLNAMLVLLQEQHTEIEELKKHINNGG